MDSNELPPAMGDNGGPSMGPAETPSETKLLADNKTMTVKLRLSHAFHSMMLHAYDALLHHGVNYRDLPHYQDTTLLDKGLAADIQQGEGHIMEWIKRMTSSVTAAIRRKGIKEV